MVGRVTDGKMTSTEKRKNTDEPESTLSCHFNMYHEKTTLRNMSNIWSLQFTGYNLININFTLIKTRKTYQCSLTTP